MSKSLKNEIWILIFCGYNISAAFSDSSIKGHGHLREEVGTSVSFPYNRDLFDSIKESQIVTHLK